MELWKGEPRIYHRINVWIDGRSGKLQCVLEGPRYMDGETEVVRYSYRMTGKATWKGVLQAIKAELNGREMPKMFVQTKSLLRGVTIMKKLGNCGRTTVVQRVAIVELMRERLDAEITVYPNGDIVGTDRTIDRLLMGDIGRRLEAMVRQDAAALAER